MTCNCGVLEELAKEYKWPLYRPLIFTRNKQLIRGQWSIKLFHATPSGNISKRATPSAVMKYCPFCGAELEEERKAA